MPLRRVCCAAYGDGAVKRNVPRHDLMRVAAADVVEHRCTNNQTGRHSPYSSALDALKQVGKRESHVGRLYRSSREALTDLRDNPLWAARDRNRRPAAMIEGLPASELTMYRVTRLIHRL